MGSGRHDLRNTGADELSYNEHSLHRDRVGKHVPKRRPGAKVGVLILEHLLDE